MLLVANRLREAGAAGLAIACPDRVYGADAAAGGGTGRSLFNAPLPVIRVVYPPLMAHSAPHECEQLLFHGLLRSSGVASDHGQML